MCPVLLAIGAAFAFASLTLADVCTSSNKDLSCLTSDTAAASYCTWALSAPGSTTTVVHTTVVSVTAKTATSDVILTPTITTGAASTEYDATYYTSIVETTVTDYSSTTSSQAVSATCDLAALTDLPGTEVSVACSCIGADPTPYDTTITKVITITQDPAAAATTFETGVIEMTVADVTTDMFTFSTTITQTATASAAAPAYTKVYGPTAGCIDSGEFNITELATSVVDLTDAVRQCQFACSSQYHMNPVTEFR